MTVLRIQKNAFQIDFPRYSVLYFSVTTSSISSIEISIENLTLVEESSTGKSLIFSLESESWQSQSSRKKTFQFNFFSIFQLKFPLNRGFVSSVKVSIKNFWVAEFFSMGILWILFLVSDYDSPKIIRIAIPNGLSRYSNSYFVVTTGLISPGKGSIENFLICRRGSNYGTICFDPCIRLVTIRKLPKNLIFFFL